MLFYIEIFREHKSQVKNLTKLPEKGILKKHGGYGIVMVDEPIRISEAITHS